MNFVAFSTRWFKWRPTRGSPVSSGSHLQPSGGHFDSGRVRSAAEGTLRASTFASSKTRSTSSRPLSTISMNNYLCAPPHVQQIPLLLSLLIFQQVSQFFSAFLSLFYICYIDLNILSFPFYQKIQREPIFRDRYKGIFRDVKQCEGACAHRFEREQEFYGLNLSVTTGNLVDSLRLFILDEVLEGISFHFRLYHYCFGFVKTLETVIIL